MARFSIRSFAVVLTLAVTVPLFAAGAPQVLSTEPPDGGIEIQQNTNIIINFDRAMDPGTINPANVLLNGKRLSKTEGADVTLPDSEGKQAMIAMPLDAGAIYQVTFTVAVKDAAGVALDKPFNFRFATAAAPEEGSKRNLWLNAWYPRYHDRDVPTNAPITLNYTDDIDPATVDGSTLTIQDINDGSIMPFHAVVQGHRVIVWPDVPFLANGSYRVEASNDIKATDGRSLTKGFSWKFTTGNGPTDAPIIAEAWVDSAYKGDDRSAILYAAVVSLQQDALPHQLQTAGLAHLQAQIMPQEQFVEQQDRVAQGTALQMAITSAVSTLSLQDTGDFIGGGDATASDGVYATRVTFPTKLPGGNYVVYLVSDSVNGVQPAPVGIPLILNPTATSGGSLAGAKTAENGPVAPDATPPLQTNGAWLTVCNPSALSGGWTWVCCSCCSGNFAYGSGNNGTDYAYWYPRPCRDFVTTIRPGFVRGSNRDTGADYWSHSASGTIGYGLVNQQGSGCSGDVTLGTVVYYDNTGDLELNSNGGQANVTIADYCNFYYELDSYYNGRRTNGTMYAGNVYNWRYIMLNPSAAYWCWSGSDFRFGHTAGTTEGPGWFAGGRVNSNPGTCPNSNMDIWFNMRSTATSGTSGEEFQLVREGAYWFGEETRCNGGMHTDVSHVRKAPFVDVDDTGPKDPGDTVRFTLQGSDSFGEGNGYSWDFDHGDGTSDLYSLQGWANANQTTVSYVGGVGMRIVCSGADPHVRSSGGLTISAERNRWMAIRMKINAGTTARVFWSGTNGGESGARTVAWTIIPDNQWHTYYVQLTSNDGWSGTTSQMRLDPYDAGPSSGTADIDFIRLYAQGQDLYLTGETLGVAGAVPGDTAMSFAGNASSYGAIYPLGFPGTAASTDFWIKTSSTTATQALLSYASSSSDNEWLIYNPTNLTLYVRGATLASGVAINDGQWHHIAVTWRSSDGQTKIYKDGAQIGTGTVSTGVTLTSGGSLYLAQEQDCMGGCLDAAQSLNGTFDEVAVYGAALSATDVSDHYAARNTDYVGAVQANSPLMYWRLGESSGNAANDIGQTTSTAPQYAKIWLGPNSNSNWTIANAELMTWDGANNYWYKDFTIPATGYAQAYYCAMYMYNSSNQSCDNNAAADRKYGDDEYARIYFINGASQSAPVISSVTINPLPVFKCGGASVGWYEATVNFTDPDGTLDTNNWSQTAYPAINLELVGPGGTLDTTFDTAHNTTCSITNKYEFHHNEDSAISSSCFERIGTTWTHIAAGADGTYLRGYANTSLYSRGAQGDEANTGSMKFAFRLASTATAGSWTARAFVRDAAGAESYADSSTFAVQAISGGPTLGAITPTSGTYNADNGYAITARYSDPNGWGALNSCQLLINTAIVTGGMQLRCDPAASLMYNLDPDTSAWSSSAAPGSSAALVQPYGVLLTENSKITVVNSTTIDVTWVIRFNPGFTGVKNLYSWAQDYCGTTVGWTLGGTGASSTVTLDTNIPSLVNVDPYGIYTGGVNLGQTGAITGDTAALFNGSTGYMYVPIDIPETGHTVEMWFKTSTAACGLFDVGAANAGALPGAQGNDRHIYLTGGNVAARLYNNEVITTSGTNYANGAWHHVAYTYGIPQGGGAATAQKLYVDGVLKVTGTKNVSDFYWQNGIAIGYSTDVSPNFFNGTIDEVAVYQTALPLARIQAHYNSGSGSVTEVVADKPLGYWRLGETSGAVAYPYPFTSTISAGRYINGVSLGAAADHTPSSGDTDTCASFDGATGYVDAGVGFKDFTGGLTIELWAYPTSTATYQRFLDFGNQPSGTDSIIFYRIGTTQELDLYVLNGATGASLAGPNVLINNQWHHYAVTLTSGKSATMYRDGAIVAGPTTLAVLPGVVNRLSNFIGKSNWAGDSLYSGRMDDVAIFNTALSQARIQAHYNNGVNAVKADSPMAFWRLGETSSNLAYAYPGAYTPLVRPSIGWAPVSGAAGYFVGWDVGYDTDDFETSADLWNGRDSSNPAIQTTLASLSSTTLGNDCHGATFDGKYFYRSNSQVVYKYTYSSSGSVLTLNQVNSYAPNIYTGITWDPVNDCFYSVKWDVGSAQKGVYKHNRAFGELGGPWVIGADSPADAHKPIGIASDGQYLYTIGREGNVWRHLLNSSGTLSGGTPAARIQDSNISLDALGGFTWGGQGIAYHDGYLYLGTAGTDVRAGAANAGRIYKVDIRNWRNPIVCGWISSGLEEIGALAIDGKWLAAMKRCPTCNGGSTNTVKLFNLAADSGWKGLYVNWPSGNSGGGRNFEGGAGSPNFESGQATSFDTNTYPYLSMSYRLATTDKVNLLVNVSGAGLQAITMTQGLTSGTYSASASLNDTNGYLVQDGAWHHKYINLDAQLTASLGAGSHIVTAVYLYKIADSPTATGQFWIDDFMIGEYVAATAYTNYTPPSDLPEGVHSFYVRAVDAAGNLGAVTSRNIEVDLPPTVTNVTATQANGSYKAGTTVAGVQVTFNSPVVVTGTPQITLETGTTDRTLDYLSGSGSATLTFATYTVQAGDNSPDLDYVASSLVLNGGTIKDFRGFAADLATLPAPGAAGSLAANKAIVIDTTSPLPTISAPSPLGINSTNSANFTVDFGESVTGLTTGGITVTATGGASATLGVSANSPLPSRFWTVSFSNGIGNGTISFKVNANAASDVAGNLSLVSADSATLKVDNIAPTPTITRTGSSPTAASSVTFQMDFGETMLNFVVGDITLTLGAGVNTGSLAGFSGGAGGVYTVSVSGISGTGTVGIAIDAGVATDVASNLNNAGTYVEYYVDQGALTCSITQTSPNPTNLATVGYQISFNKQLLANSFTTGDLQLTGSLASGASLANFTQTQSSPAIWTVDVTNVAGTGTIILTLPPSTVQDYVGNTNSQGCGPVTYNIDQGDFACTVSRTGVTPTKASTVGYHIVFAKSVADFDVGDITLGGSITGTSLANFSGSGTTYDVDVTNISSATPGTVSITVTADKAHDQAGNKNNSSGAVVYNIDQQAPTVSSINRSVPTAQTTNSQSVVYRVTFSETVTGVADVDFTPTVVSGDITGASVTSINIVGGTITDVTVDTGSSGSGTLRLDVLVSQGATISDSVTNAMTADYTSGQVYTIDRDNPTVTSIARLTPATSPTNATSVVYRVTFSRNVNNVDTGDFQVIDLGNSLSGESVTSVSAGSGTTIDVTVATGTGSSGQLRLDVNAGTATIQDDVGNPLNTSFISGEVYTIDRTALTATITRTSPNPNNASSVGYHIVFNKSVSDFVQTDVTMGGDIPDIILGALTGGGTTYDINVTNIHGSGTVNISLAADVAHDAAGNGNQAANPVDYTIDQDALFCTVLRLSSNPSNAGTVSYQVGFNKEVDDFEVGDITLGGSISGTSLANFTQTQVDPGLFTVDVINISTATTGTVSIELAADVAHDVASNGNGGCGPVAYNIDQGTPGVVSINRQSPSNQVTNAQSVVYRVIFSEAVTGVGTADFTPTVVVGGITGASVSSVNVVNTTTADVTVNTGSGSGDLRLDVVIPGATIQDGAGNAISSSFTSGQIYTIDRDSPTVASIVRYNPAGSSTNATSVVYRVTFTRNVNDVDIADFTLTDLDDSLTGEAVTSVSAASGTVIDVTADTGTGNSGHLRLDVNADTATITDDVANPLTHHFFDGQVYTIDRTALSAFITRTSTNPTNATGVSYHIAFNKPVSDFAVEDITLESDIPNVTLGSFSAGYNVNVVNINGSGWLGISLGSNVAHDAAGNGNQAAARVDYTIDQDGLFCTLTRLSTNPTNASTVSYQISFNKSVSDFDIGGITLGGTAPGRTLSNFAGSGTTYTTDVSGITGSGTVSIELAAGVAHDDASNANNGCGPLSYSIDQANLTCTITRTSSNPTNAATVGYQFAFNKPVSDFIITDITLGGTVTGTSLANFATVTTSVYTANVTGITGTGTVSVGLNPGVAHDSVGNPNQAAAAVIYDVNQNPLTVTINQGNSQSDPTNSFPVTFDVVFNRSVSDFASGDVNFGGTSVVSAYNIQGSGTTYTVNVTALSSEGTIIASLNGAVAHDDYGNGNTASTSTDNTVLYSTGAAPQIQSWSSVRTHTGGGGGNLSIPLDATWGDSDEDPGPTCESRRFGVRKIVVQFSKPVQVVGSIDSSFTLAGWGVGGNPSSYLSAVSGRTLSGSTLTVDFTSNAMPNLYRFKMTINGGSFRDPDTLLPVTGDLDCQFRSLLGNINSDPYLDSTDLGTVKAKNRASANQDNNARYDLNLDGQINVIDLALISSRLNIDECP